MAAASPDLSTKTRHLRPRETAKKINASSDSPAGLTADTKSGFGRMEDEDAEVLANTTASHYLNSRSGSKRKNEALITVHNTPKRRRIVHNGGSSNETGEASASVENPNEDLQDVYCWECHKECVDGALDCASCPRTYHPLCIPSLLAAECGTEPSESWICPVCFMITKAECVDTRSWAMQQLNIDQFCTILGFSLQRMKHSDVKTSEAFHYPVPISLLPDYYDIVFHPMDLSTLDKNIKKKMYASTEAFVEDAKWILHNSMIYNGSASKHTADAKLIIKLCKHEAAEIELCPDCYLNSCIRKENWFVEPCTAPHCLVWAKLKGFPYWPAKALRVSPSGMVDVRFFGAHDRAWIPLNQVYVLSAECPLTIKNTKKFGLDKAMSELQTHIKRLRERFGDFTYAPVKSEFKTDYLYFCPLLFGKDVANSELAKKMLASMAGRRYRASSFDGKDDYSLGLVKKRVGRKLEGADDLHPSISMEDDQSSDAESRTNETATPSRRSVNQGEPNEMNDDTMESNDGMDTTPTIQRIDGGRSSVERVEKESDNSSKNGPQNNSSSSNQPPIRVKLSLANLKKGKIAEISSEPRISTQSPDSTSANGATAGSISITTAGPNGGETPPKNATPVINLDLTTSPEQTDEGSSVEKRSSVQNPTMKTTPSKDDEPSTRKRNLQSVLAKMQMNVQQRQRSVSPSGSDASGIMGAFDSVLPPKRNDEPRASSANNPQLEKRFGAGVSTSSTDNAVLCEKYMDKINEFMRLTMSEMMREVSYQDASSSSAPRDSSKEVQTQNHQLTLLRAEFGRLQSFYNEAIRAMKHTSKVTFAEMQQAIEAEKSRAIVEMKLKFEEEKKQAVAETKLKQWCAQCGKEAVFYCCWNTSYCDYPCQQQHWPKHQATCAQIRNPPSAEANASVNTPTFGGVFVGGNRVTTNAQATLPAGVVYASQLPNSGFIRTSGLPQQTVSASKMAAAMVRKIN